MASEGYSGQMETCMKVKYMQRPSKDLEGIYGAMVLSISEVGIIINKMELELKFHLKEINKWVCGNQVNMLMKMYDRVNHI